MRARAVSLALITVAVLAGAACSNAPLRIAAELQAAKLTRGVLSERQLEEVMTDFWFSHFNVDARKGAVRWMIGDYERTAIRPHALGKFRDLLLATAHHPAMLVRGGPVKGGRMAGRWPGLAREQIYGGRDLAVTTDFRNLFAEVAVRHLGVPVAAPLFPGFAANPAKYPGVLV